MTQHHTLNADWTLTFTHPDTHQRCTIPATVPGNVECDLMRSQLIDDPMPADNPAAMHRWELVNDWTYRTTFDAPTLPPNHTLELVFAGIDTVAEIFLNGQKLRDCANMFIPHILDITAHLKPEKNTLDVRIASAELAARAFHTDALAAAMPRHEASLHLRKARHAWGWDNAPRLLTAGLWRNVSLRIQPPIRLADVYLYTRTLQNNTAHLGVDWKLITDDSDLAPYAGEIRFSRNGQLVKQHAFIVDHTFGRITDLAIDNPELWWPRGYGPAPLYDVELRITRNNTLVADWHTRFGIRTIDLLRTETTDDHAAGEFLFRCNGENIYCRGTNWKPLDALPSQAHAKLTRALDLCIDCNCNMLRVWGGGVYEDHHFFDYCDANGLLVWQDFMLACEFPPQDDAYHHALADEARSIVTQLRNHPSLALWCGDNETDMFVTGHTRLRPSDNRATRQTLKRVTLQLDPYRPYLESSPYLADAVVEARARTGVDPSLALAPEQHVYIHDVHFRDIYRSSNAHFISETGPIFFCAIAESPDIVARELPRAKRLWNAPHAPCNDWRHQADPYFIQWRHSLTDNLAYVFNQTFSIDAIDDLTFATNFVVADLFKFAIEHFRIHKWRRTGVLWWSLIDMWPMMFNFSVVDSHFRPKRPYAWIKHAQQPLCLIAQTDDASQTHLFAVNDTLAERSGHYRLLALTDDTDAPRLCHEAPFRCERNASTCLAENILPSDPATLYLIQWTLNDAPALTGTNHVITGRPPFSFDLCRRWSAAIDRLYASANDPAPNQQHR